MRYCKICNQEKFYELTAKSCSKASGFLGAVCWDCYLLSDAKRNAARKATPEGRAKANAANRATQAKNRTTPEGLDKIRAVQRAAKAKTRATPEGREKLNAAVRAWQKANRGKSNANCTRYAIAKIQRVPPWADLAAIKQVYTKAASKGLTVDHIYPLRGALVSGLHVANNLQLLTQTENSSKGNRLLET
jgi:5-methylcytosine-specific restriction endonuclease McrA